MTIYRFNTGSRESEGRFIELDVPFSLLELMQIQDLSRYLLELRLPIMEQSTWKRNIFLEMRIPWAYSLRNRENALNALTNTKQLVQRAMLQSEKFSESEVINLGFMFETLSDLIPDINSNID